MKGRRLAAALLLRLYPAAWRREYGAELADILEARRLRPLVIADVVWNALCQRVRVAQPSTILGVVSMLVIVSPVIASSGPTGLTWAAWLHPSFMTFPTVKVTFMESELYALLLAGCGWWTYWRYRGTAARCGVAAMRMSLITGMPVLLVGGLFASGALDVPQSFTAPGRLPSPLAIIMAPLSQIPQSWIWGAVGGRFGCWLSRIRQTA